MDTIYYLESIEPNANGLNATVTLFNATLHYNQKNLEESAYFRTMEIPINDTLEDVFSGFFKVQDNSSLVRANETTVARHYISQTTSLRKKILSRAIPNDDPHDLGRDVFSYHVNVGHGNCSFIVDTENKKIYSVDCGEFDYMNRVNYRKNIMTCIQYIMRKFKLTDFKVDVMILTHAHYDHYSGFNNLIRAGYINSSTTAFINLHYQIPSPSYNTFLRNLNNAGIASIEPVVHNSTKSINIIHPANRIIRTRSRSHHHPRGVIIEPSPNNSSVVLQIKTRTEGFMFTGDIETSGWNRTKLCFPYMANANFYAISHHGSTNGHVRSTCPALRKITSVKDCLYGRSTIPLIMGRSGSYSGVPSSSVLHDFPTAVFSEKDPHNIPASFIEIEWTTKKMTWH